VSRIRVGGAKVPPQPWCAHHTSGGQWICRECLLYDLLDDQGETYALVEVGSASGGRPGAGDLNDRVSWCCRV